LSIMRSVLTPPSPPKKWWNIVAADRYGFGREPQFEALLAFLDDEPAGLALFHPRFSTWLL
jgi:hypothetical protein